MERDDRHHLPPDPKRIIDSALPAPGAKILRRPDQRHIRDRPPLPAAWR
jgi:pyridoxine 5'-phosphate synthase PdxJ